MVREMRHVRDSIPKEMDLAVDMHGFCDAPTGKRAAIAAENPSGWRSDFQRFGPRGRKA